MIYIRILFIIFAVCHVFSAKNIKLKYLCGVKSGFNPELKFLPAGLVKLYHTVLFFEVLDILVHLKSCDIIKLKIIMDYLFSCFSLN